jgi:hypothetical protein
MKLSVICGASLIAFAGACTTGAVGDDVPGDDGGGDDSSDRITCEAAVTLSGTMVAETQPAEVIGCWPVGTWTFSPTLGTNTCPTPPPLLGTYAFTGERDLTSAEPDFTWIFTVTAPNDPTAHVGVSSGGGGLCSAAMMVYSADGKTVTNLHPALGEGGVLTGNGTYEVHTTDQRPAPPS